jgi:hypothetical protein
MPFHQRTSRISSTRLNISLVVFFLTFGLKKEKKSKPVPTLLDIIKSEARSYSTG